MRKYLFVSAGAVVELATLSVIALANSNMETPAEGHIREEVSSCTVEAGAPPLQRERIIRETQIITPQETEKSSEQSGSEGEYQGIIYSMDWDAEESYMLAKIAMAEAEGEDTEGKALVMLVVLNRVWSDEFPDSIEEVIYEDRQFSPVASGRYDRVEPDEDCWQALELVTSEGWDESWGALYFERESASTWHRDNLQFLFQHGNHLFYTDRGE